MKDPLRLVRAGHLQQGVDQSAPLNILEKRSLKCTLVGSGVSAGPASGIELREGTNRRSVLRQSHHLARKGADFGIVVVHSASGEPRCVDEPASNGACLGVGRTTAFLRGHRESAMRPHWSFFDEVAVVRAAIAVCFYTDELSNPERIADDVLAGVVRGVLDLAGP